MNKSLKNSRDKKYGLLHFSRFLEGKILVSKYLRFLLPITTTNYKTKNKYSGSPFSTVSLSMIPGIV